MKPRSILRLLPPVTVQRADMAHACEFSISAMAAHFNNTLHFYIPVPITRKDPLEFRSVAATFSGKYPIVVAFD